MKTLSSFHLHQKHPEGFWKHWWAPLPGFALSGSEGGQEGSLLLPVRMLRTVAVKGIHSHSVPAKAFSLLENGLKS